MQNNVTSDESAGLASQGKAGLNGTGNSSLSNVNKKQQSNNVVSEQDADDDFDEFLIQKGREKSPVQEPNQD